MSIEELEAEYQLAWRNARGADTAGRYDWASYYEWKAEEIAKEIKERKANENV